MRLKRTLVALSALILLPVLLLAAVVVFLDVADLSRYREAIAEQASSLAGRRVSLNGELDLNVAATTSVVISDFALANADWASEPEMLTIDRVEVQIDLLPLLRGNIHIPRFHVRGVKSRIETREDGVNNWSIAEQQGTDDSPSPGRKAAGLQLPWLGDVSVAGVEVAYIDAQSGQSFTAVIDDASIRSTAPNAPVEISMQGGVDETPVDIDGTLALPGRLDTGSIDIPVKLRVEALDIRANASGSIRGSVEAPAINLSATASAADLNALRRILGDAVPDLQNLELAVEIAGDQGQPVTLVLDAAAGEARLDAEMKLHRDSPRPKLVASIDINKIDIVQLWAAYFRDTPRQASLAQRDQKSSPALQLDKPIVLDGLDALDADIALSANTIRLPQMRIIELNSRFYLDDRVLRIKNTKMVTDAGSVDAQLELNGRGKVPEIMLGLDTTDIQLDRLPVLSENERINGSKARAAVSITAKGASVSGLIDSLAGNVALDYVNQKSRDKLSLTAKRQRVSDSEQSPLEVVADGAFEGHAIELNGQIIPPDQLVVSDKPYTVNLSLQALGIVARAAGTIPATFYGTELGIEAQADNFDQLRQAFGQTVPKLERSELTTRLILQPSELKLSKLQARSGDGRIEGWVTVNTSKSIPDLQAELAFTDLNIDELMPPDDETTAAKAAATPAEKPASDRVFSDEPLPFEALSRANVRASLRATNLVMNNRRMKQAEMNIKLADGRLSASLVKLASAQGDLLGDVVIDTSGRADPVVEIKLKAARIELGEILATSEGAAPIEGPLATDIHLKGRGNSVAQIMGSLDGKVYLLIEQGSADAKALDLFVGGLSAMFGTIFAADSSKTRINCAICDLKINKGALNTQIAVLDTQYSTVFVEGQVNLKSEQIDLKVSPEAKGVTLSVAFPVLVKGQFAAPNIDVEKTGALIKTGELWATVAYPPVALLKFDDLVGDDKQNPCVAMVAEKAGIPILKDVGKVVKGAVDGTGKVVEGTVEGTEKVVKGVGGVLKGAGSGLGKIFDTSADAEPEESDEEEEDDFDMDF